MNNTRRPVPCNGCKACCTGEAIVLHPEDGDDIASYEHIVREVMGKTRLILKTKPNGDCIYLGENGCTIHHRAPAICKTFDCRRYYLHIARTSAERRAAMRDPLMRDVIKAGKERLGTL